MQQNNFLIQDYGCSKSETSTDWDGINRTGQGLFQSEQELIVLLFLFPVSFFSNWKGSRAKSEETFQMILTPPSRKAWSVSLHWELLESCIHLPGEGNGTPPQYSCLENPRERGAWWAAVYGVTQSRTRLKRLSSSSSSIHLTPLLLLFNNIFLENTNLSTESRFLKLG